MTKTKKFSQSPKTYFSIVLNTAIKKRWWLYLLVTIVGIVHLFSYIRTNTMSHLVWAIFGFGYLIFMYLYLYRFAHSKDQSDFLSEKQIFFDKETLRIEETLGGSGEVPFERIQKVLDKGKFWMLYISKNQFFYVPKDIFYSELDFEMFQRSIHRS